MSAADPYAISPGYYDLFRAKSENALPSVSFFADLAPVGGSALEIGPGTGRLALAVAERVASLWCLERSPTMRAVLVAKLAQQPRLWSKVTVWDGAAPTFALGRQFDYVYFGGVLEHVAPDQRPVLFRTVADHVVPGGLVAMDMVLTEPAPDHPEKLMDEVSLGELRYTLSASATALGPDLSELRMTYHTYLGERLVATEPVRRLHHMHRQGPVLADLAAVGLLPADGDGDGIVNVTNDQTDPGAVVVRRSSA